MKFARVNNITLHYQVDGALSGKPVLVFANSLGTDFRIWDAVVSDLSCDFTVVRYDKRGHGLSELGAPPYSMDDHVSDLAVLLDHLKFSNAIICGLSVGGMIAQGLYLARPDLVSALVLCDTGHKIGTADMWQERIAALEADGLPSMVDAVMARWFTPAFRKTDNPVYMGCRAMLARQDLAGYTGTCAAIATTDMTDCIGTVRVPVLCVVGDQDLATPPALVRELSELIPSARYVEVEGAGHIPCVEQPERLVRALRSFFINNSILQAVNE